MSDLDNLKAAVADQKLLLLASNDALTAQGALLTRAIATLDGLAARVGGSSDPTVAALAADIIESNASIRAENAGIAAQTASVSAELDKIATPPDPAPPAPAA